MNNKVVILGAGEIGSALAKVLSANMRNKIELWDKNPLRNPGQKDMAELLESAQFVLLAVPSKGLSEAVKRVDEFAAEDAVVVSVSKGLEPSSKKFSAELLADKLGVRRVGVLAGPMIAEELMDGAKSAAILAGTREMFEVTSPLFEDTLLHLEYSEDILGSSVLGVLKNIYSILIGAATELDLGSNTLGDLVTQIVQEMGELVVVLGGELESVLTYAGIGDLIGTAFSANSSNHAAGVALAKGDEPQKISEGMVSLELLLNRLGDAEIPPVLMAAKKLVLDRKSVHDALSAII